MMKFVKISDSWLVIQCLSQNRSYFGGFLLYEVSGVFFWWVSYIKSISGDEYSQEQEEFDPQSAFHLS